MRRSLVWAIGVGCIVGVAGMPVASCSNASSQPGQLGGNTVDATAETGKESGPETGHDASEAEAAVESGTSGDGGCDGGLSLCSGLCTDTQTDPSNCNKCGNACGSGVSCVGGVCQCSADAGQTLCTTASGTRCVDTLTDPDNCGACLHTCQVQGTNVCAGGYCQPAVVASPNAPIWSIAVSSTTIYWTEPANGSNNGAILKKDFAGNNAIATITSAVADPRGIALDANNVYWVNYGSSAIQEYKLLGGAPITDWPLFDDAGAPLPPVYAQPLAVAWDASYIYWVANQTGDVLRVPIGSNGATAPTVIQSGESNPVSIAVDGANVYWCDYGTSTNPADGAVRQKAKDGSGSAITLAANEPSPWGIAIDADNVYWTDKVNPGFVKQIAIGATSGAITLAQNEGAPYGIATAPESLDGGAPDKNVYWTDYDDNSVNKVPIGGGAKFQYAVQQTTPSAITVDRKNIYWVNGGTGSGTILEVTK